MANTSNIGLAKLDGTEKLKTFPTTFNGDMDTIDTVVGNDVGTSRTISQAITKTEEGIAIVANGNTHSAISSGQYVYVKNHGSLSEGMYQAKAAISANAALSTGNLTAVSGGGLNHAVSALNSNIINLIKYTEYNATFIDGFAEIPTMTGYAILTVTPGQNSAYSDILIDGTYQAVNGKWYAHSGTENISRVIGIYYIKQ